MSGRIQLERTPIDYLCWLSVSGSGFTRLPAGSGLPGLPAIAPVPHTTCTSHLEDKSEQERNHEWDKPTHNNVQHMGLTIVTGAWNYRYKVV